VLGLSEKPTGGYDAGTLAGDLVALMDALGHERFALVRHDTGYIVGYALAADHPEGSRAWPSPRSPGSRGGSIAAAVRPGADQQPGLAHPLQPGERRADRTARQGTEDIFFGYEFSIQGGEKLPDDALKYYFSLFSDPDALRGSFGLYRAWDTTLAQNEERKRSPLAMPVLAIGGAASWGERAGEGMKPAADDVQTVVIPGAGHWVAEQAPEEMLAALTTFLAPYRDGSGRSSTSGFGSN
jgi:pimeloyl-ACP methyl ester carboxylesterase